jgi:hypothetical protein
MQQYRPESPEAMRWPKFRSLAARTLAILACTTAVANDLSARPDGLLWSGANGEISNLRTALPRVTDPVLAALTRLEIAAAELDQRGVHREIDAYNALHDRDPARLALAASLESSTAFAKGDYALAERASERWLTILDRNDPEHDKLDAAQVHDVAALLAKAPAMRVSGTGARIATSRDTASLLRGHVDINGISEEAVLDTGANLPVLSASLAKAAHARIIDGAASVGSASRSAVATRIGIVDQLNFSGFTFRNVPFLILDDSQLQMPVPGGYRIDAIIGFPVFRAIGSMTFGKGFFRPGPALASGPHNLTAAGNDLYVAVEAGGLNLPLHLDTGAKASELSALFARRHPELLGKLERSTERNAGAGGVTTHPIAHWKSTPVVVAGSAITLADLPIVLADPEDMTDHNLGTLGQDVLQRFSSYTIDLTTMRFRLQNDPEKSSS